VLYLQLSLGLLSQHVNKLNYYYYYFCDHFIKHTARIRHICHQQHPSFASSPCLYVHTQTIFPIKRVGIFMIYVLHQVLHALLTSFIQQQQMCPTVTMLIFYILHKWHSSPSLIQGIVLGPKNTPHYCCSRVTTLRVTHATGDCKCWVSAYAVMFTLSFVTIWNWFTLWHGGHHTKTAYLLLPIYDRNKVDHVISNNITNILTTMTSLSEQ
jgi:hypothetical protein